MMHHSKIGPSKLWQRINETLITRDRIKSLSSFRSDAVNFKISLWNPGTNGLRYLKMLTFNLCAGLTAEEREIIRKTKKRHVGDPYTVRYDGEDMCLDYIQAAYELAFLRRHAPLDRKKILEIGAGYGRTCHALLSNHDVRSYCIIDLHNCLELSRRYLKTVLPDRSFRKIRFVPIERIGDIDAERFDCVINIDSFAEMEPQTVREYLRYIDVHAAYFYVKNPVGKYEERSLVANPTGNRLRRFALQTGLLRDLVDIYDTESVRSKVGVFRKAYRPGPGWTCAGDAWARPWAFYWQAVYKNTRKR